MGWSIIEMAEKTDVSEEVYNSYESGRIGGSLDMIFFQGIQSIPFSICRTLQTQSAYNAPSLTNSRAMSKQ
jgi:hypothetical protein